MPLQIVVSWKPMEHHDDTDGEKGKCGLIATNVSLLKIQQLQVFPLSLIINGRLEKQLQVKLTLCECFNFCNIPLYSFLMQLITRCRLRQCSDSNSDLGCLVCHFSGSCVCVSSLTRLFLLFRMSRACCLMGVKISGAHKQRVLTTHCAFSRWARQLLRSFPTLITAPVHCRAADAKGTSGTACVFFFFFKTDLSHCSQHWPERREKIKEKWS